MVCTARQNLVSADLLCRAQHFRRALLQRVARAASELCPGQHPSFLTPFCFVKSFGPNLLSIFLSLVRICTSSIQVVFKYLVSRFQNIIWAWLWDLYLIDSCIFYREMWRSHCSRDHLSLCQSVLPLQSVDGAAWEATRAICGMARGSPYPGCSTCSQFCSETKQPRVAWHRHQRCLKAIFVPCCFFPSHHV